MAEQRKGVDLDTADTAFMVPVTLSASAALEWVFAVLIPAVTQANKSAQEQRLFELSAERIAELASACEALVGLVRVSSPEVPWPTSADVAEHDLPRWTIQESSAPAVLYLTRVQAAALLHVLTELAAPTYEDIQLLARALGRSTEFASIVAVDKEILEYTKPLTPIAAELKAQLSQTPTTVRSCVNEILHCCRVPGFRPMLFDGDSLLAPHRLLDGFILAGVPGQGPARIEWLVPRDEIGQSTMRLRGDSGKAQPVALLHLPEERGDEPRYQVVLMPC